MLISPDLNFIFFSPPPSKMRFLATLISNSLNREKYITVTLSQKSESRIYETFYLF